MNRENTPLRIRWSVALLVASAAGTILFIVLATLLGIRATNDLASTRAWVEHSDRVILSLQQISGRLDHIDAYSRLEQLSNDPEYRRSLQTSSLGLLDLARRLQTLVQDNPNQEARAAILKKQVDLILQSVQDPSAQHPLPLRLLLDCRESAVQMGDAERQLRSNRLAAEHPGNAWIDILRFLFSGGSSLVVLALFSLLLRDELRRGRFEQMIQETNRQLASTIKILEQNAVESGLLTAARDELQLCADVDDVYACGIRYFQRLLPQTSGALCIINNSWQKVELAAEWNRPSDLLGGFSLDSCCSLRTGRPRWRKPGGSEVHCTHFQIAAPDYYLCMQLSAYGETLGILYVECASPEIVAEVEERSAPLQGLAELVSLTAASLNLRRKLERQSVRDGLTNLFNRYFMEIALQREMHRANRYDQQVAVMMLDLDHFKSFNDSYGHDAGDLVLRELAACLTASVRNEDTVCRYGGEEFVIILPGISGESAVDRANLLRRAVHDMSLRHHGVPLRQITISIGISMYPQHGATIEQLLRTADRALYKAKDDGRDCVVLTDDFATA